MVLAMTEISMKKESERLVSLDVFRGSTMALMIFVNFVGVGIYFLKDNLEQWAIAKTIYKLIDHAEWHGSFLLADFVFPFFLYISGMGLAYKYRKFRAAQNPGNNPVQPDEPVPVESAGATNQSAIAKSSDQSKSSLYKALLYRTLGLLAIGLLLNSVFWSFPDLSFKLSKVRWTGVLQRIALATGLASFIALRFQLKTQWKIAAGILISHWLLLAWGQHAYEPQHNLAAYIDRVIPKDHAYAGADDPEGILGTFPAAVNALLGYFHGVWLIDTTQKSAIKNSQPDNINRPIMFGLAALVVGGLWGVFLPINKHLWTGSFVLFMSGSALLAFTLCYELLDVRKMGKAWIRPLEAMGKYSLTAFVGSVLMIKIMKHTSIAPETNLYQYIVQQFLGWTGAGAIAVLALLMVALWLAICHFLVVFEKKKPLQAKDLSSGYEPKSIKIEAKNE
jgi:predicted acyltransferase